MEPGELLAYRKRAIDPLEPVTYLRHRRGNAKKDMYSLVRFESEDADGREEWVPDGRLKCPWDEAEKFEAVERQWAPVLLASRIDRATEEATWRVLEVALLDGLLGNTCPPAHVPNQSSSSWYSFVNLDSLSELTGIAVDVLRGDPTSFEQDGEWVLPASTAALIAEKLAARDPAPILKQVERDEQELEAEQRHQKMVNPHSSPPQGFLQGWEEREASCRLRRQWVGADSVNLRQQALDSEQEIERLRGLVEWSIGKLEGYGHKSSAQTLRRYLGAES